MTITQLLIDTAVLAGVLLFAALAIVPLWLEHEAERADRAEPGPATDGSTHGGRVATVHRIAAGPPVTGRPAPRPRAA